MSRFLFVVPPLAGHINPTVAVATELTGRGHEIAWAGHEATVSRLVGPNAFVLPCALPEFGVDEPIRPSDLRGPLAFKFLWQQFIIPLAEAMIPGVEMAVADFAPDVLVVDQQAIAGAVVAERLGLPWATSASTSSELTDPLAGMPKVADWLRELLWALEERYGRPDRSRYAQPLGDLRFSPRLVLAYTTEALVGAAEGLDGVLRYIGPALAPRPASPDFPWTFLDAPGPAVLVTLGTANADVGGRFLQAAAEAIAVRPELRGVVVDPTGAVTVQSDNVISCQHVPQLELLSRMSAVVCHAGHNTVCESLAQGLPLVVAPILDDQPIIAQQVVDAGAGVRLRFTRAGVEHIGAALDKVMTDRSYTLAAERIQRSFLQAGGAAMAADELLALAAGPR